MSEPPIALEGEARRFWDRHVDRLETEGILTPKDLDAFAVCALTWQRICELRSFEAGANNYREMIQLTNLMKQFAAFAKQFGLLPRERRMAKMDGGGEAKKDEFGL